MARHGARRAGRWPVQYRFKTDLTSEQYVSRQAWRNASLNRCPCHPGGGCGFARHGTYRRIRPHLTRIPRWYCAKAHRTFSLLPDCFAARLSGTLDELETVVVEVEQARSLEAAADRLRPDIELPGALRWLRRRVTRIHTALHLIKGLLPDLFAGCEPLVSSFRRSLELPFILTALREIAAPQLAQLPTPLGLRAPLSLGGEAQSPVQHGTGTDPPSIIV